MKKIYLSLLSFFLIQTLSAQVSIGVNANYTYYQTFVHRSTPGASVRVGYSFSSKDEALVSFTYGKPIKTFLSTTSYDYFGNSITLPVEIKYQYKALNLLIKHSFIGSEETKSSFYGIAGSGLVFFTDKEIITASYDENRYPTFYPQYESTHYFTLNCGIGGTYSLGKPILFGEAQITEPVSAHNVNYFSNHFSFNLGIKLPLGRNK